MTTTQYGAAVQYKRRRLAAAAAPVLEGAINGLHLIIKTDVSSDNSPLIKIPEGMLSELQAQMLRMGTVKIQFGLEVQYENAAEELKTWIVSNRAVPCSPSFFADGIAKLNEKLSTFSEHSSGWMLVSII